MVSVNTEVRDVGVPSDGSPFRDGGRTDSGLTYNDQYRDERGYQDGRVSLVAGIPLLQESCLKI